MMSQLQAVLNFHSFININLVAASNTVTSTLSNYFILTQFPLSLN